GYKKKKLVLKTFYIKKEYDYFADYEDGIYEISKKEYMDFYKGKNMSLDYSRDGIIYMLKKNEYYCFIRPSKEGLSIMNGGALKRLQYKDVKYYYNNMDKTIDTIKRPLEEYTACQEKVAKQIKAIGGSGNIHGCIVDIDFYSHVYINPFDLSITGYYALDMIRKLAYKNIPSLLKDKCPQLYENLKRIDTKSGENMLIVKDNAALDLAPQFYPDTDIYKASRAIRKMQKLRSGVLTTWYDTNTNMKMLE
ncbi:MAG: hypothetical protein K5669_11050, partial [Lachnospiraceae bacterium]|nr:hypothetical protein [Lachnospiraceae bacterium]